MADRRRVNGPIGGTLPPLFLDEPSQDTKKAEPRTRPPDQIRKIFLKTGITPSASGSAYLEVSTSSIPNLSGPKLSCTVHGPRALPRSTPFSPYMSLSTHVKYAPFATKHRRGYLRDSTERDLSIHLETALRGVIIADRWPKSGVDVIISVIEGEQDRSVGLEGEDEDEVWDTMNILSDCITVASAALADAGIDCVDTCSGGVAAVVGAQDGSSELVVDPISSQHEQVLAACCVAYLPQREEVTNLWVKGSLSASDTAAYASLVEKAVLASKSANGVLVECLRETVGKGG